MVHFTVVANVYQAIAAVDTYDMSANNNYLHTHVRICLELHS